MGKMAFGELELAILKIVRDTGLTTVRKVYETLGSQGSYTTIMTVMSRLADKDELKRKKDGKHYVYWIPEPQLQSSTSRLFKRIKEKIFGDKPLAMVSYLLESDVSLNEDNLQEIERMIEKRRAQNKNHG